MNIEPMESNLLDSSTIELRNGLLWWRNDNGSWEVPILASSRDLLTHFCKPLPQRQGNQDTISVPLPVEDLQKRTDTIAKAQVALDHISSLKRHEPASDSKKPKGKIKSRADQRLQALEHKRSRLQSKRLGEVMESEEENAWIHMVRAYNSFALVGPILAKALSHPDMHNTSITINGEGLIAKNTDKEAENGGDEGSVSATQTSGAKNEADSDNGTVPQTQLRKEKRKGRKKNSKCWLLGDIIYEKVTKKALNTVKTRIESLVEQFTRDRARIMLNGFPREEVTKVGEQLYAAATGSVVTVTCPLLNEMRNNRSKLLKLDEMLDLVPSTELDCQHEEYLQAVHRLHARIFQLLRNRFPESTLSIYGSCLSDLSTGRSSDIDLSFHLDSLDKEKMAFELGELSVRQYENNLRRTVLQVCRKLEPRAKEFSQMNPITRARVPVVSGRYLKAQNPYTADGSLDFDICFLNDIAVANSRLLREYSLVDMRVKKLMTTVKLWAKQKGVCSAKDSTYSSYTWMNLVIFFLQARGYIPNLQSADLMTTVGAETDKSNRWHSVNDLDTFFLTWELVQPSWESNLSNVPISELLYDFFFFFSKEWRPEYMISIRRGLRRFPKTSFRSRNQGFAIEDPFETFDSHCPHDLGSHASELGYRKIMSALSESACHLAGVIELMLQKGCISDGTKPWVSPKDLTPEEGADHERIKRSGQEVTLNPKGKAGRKSRQKASRTLHGKLADDKSNVSKHNANPVSMNEKRVTKNRQRNNLRGRKTRRPVPDSPNELES